MRILWLSHYSPSFPDGAPNALSYLLLQELSTRNRISYFPLTKLPKTSRTFLRSHGIPIVESESSHSTDTRLKAACTSQLRSLKQSLPSHLEEKLHKMVSPVTTAILSRIFCNMLKTVDFSQFDVVHCDDVRFAALLASVPSTVLKTLMVLDVVPNAIEHRLAFEHRWLRRYLLRREQRILTVEQSSRTKCADICFAMSELERQWIQDHGGTAIVAPAAIDCDYFALPGQTQALPDGGPWLIYSGDIGFAPHTDAVIHFIRDIFPQVRRMWPQAGFLVVGKRPPPAISRLAGNDDRIIVTGAVDDVRPYMRAADIVVIPMRFGSGVRIKIMEALCLGKPVISTPVGCEGMNLENEKHLLLAETAEEFVDAVSRILAQPETTQEMIRSGQQLIKQQFDYRSVAALIEKQWHRLLAGDQARLPTV